ncbi:hypothetical protein H2204_002832 [Knufia peltigerae]|uniref:Uncharacterized protein n=1 Tax=Knufia peltigerae TaxID=1002370 RepID=A0AA38YBL3_9EURO|nr:hypothetical protein H2204_002832 [Knufia peltigerae]
MPPETSPDANKPVHDRSSSQANRVSAVEVHNSPHPGTTKTRGKAKQTPARQLAQDAESSQLKKTKLPATLPGCHDKILTQTNQLVSKDEEIKKLKEAKKRLQASKSELSNKLKSKKQKFQELVNKLQKLQDERLENAVSHELPPIPDEEVNKYLGKIFLDTKGLSNRWAIGTWRQIDEKSHSEMMVKLETMSPQPLWSRRMNHAIKEKKIAPKIIVNTIINASLCNETFLRPFAYLRKPDSKLANGVIEDSLKWLIETATADSHAWNQIVQAKILRAIDMPFAVERWQPDGMQCSPAVLRLRNEHIRLTCFTIIQRCRPFLKKLEHEAELKRTNELEGIVRECQAMSSALTVQFSCIKIFFWSELDDQYFATGHRDHEPHRGMKLKDGDDDEEGRDPKECGIEGSLIDMVVEPLVLRLGDTSGVNQDILQNIRKAVVWVVAPDNGDGTAKVSGRKRRPYTNQDVDEASTQRPLQSEKETLHAAQTRNSKRNQKEFLDGREPVPTRGTKAEYQSIEPSMMLRASNGKSSSQTPLQQNDTVTVQPQHDDDLPAIKTEEMHDDVISVSSEDENGGSSSESSRRTGNGRVHQETARDSQQKHGRSQPRVEKRPASPAAAEGEHFTDDVRVMEPVAKRTVSIGASSRPALNRDTDRKHREMDFSSIPTPQNLLLKPSADANP